MLLGRREEGRRKEGRGKEEGRKRDTKEVLARSGSEWSDSSGVKRLECGAGGPLGGGGRSAPPGGHGAAAEQPAGGVGS
ncbi:unnamed protein product [Arctogadus glacialis]